MAPRLDCNRVKTELEFIRLIPRRSSGHCRERGETLENW